MAELPSTTKRPFADHKESGSAPGGTKRRRLESFAQVCSSSFYFDTLLEGGALGCFFEAA